MKAEVLRPVEQDEFLVAAPLFRFGPWALMLVGVLLSTSVLIASIWRIEVSRKGEYDRAFSGASANATAVHASVAQLFDLLQHVTFSLQSLHNVPDPAAALRRQFSLHLGLQDRRIKALVINADGRVLAAVPGLQLDAAAIERIVSSWSFGGPALLKVLPEMALGDSPGSFVPVIYPLALDDEVAAVVFLVDVEALTLVFLQTLDQKAGWLRLADPSGATVLEVHRGVAASETSDAAIHAAAYATDQAMAQPVDYASRRLLIDTVASEESPLSVTIGLNEAGVLDDLRNRVRATWFIFGVSMFVVMSLVTITSLALRKFAIKEAHLRRLATIDILTGLPNRRSFHHILAKAVQLAQRRQQILGLMFVDLDNFKDINDTMGHEAGDELLQRVGQMLVQAVRPGDRVCRLGGDEFTVLLADLNDVDDARRIAQRVLDVLAQTQRVRNHEVRTHASIGIALMPEHGTSMSDLMRFADTAMYRAKQNGKSAFVVYDESMAAQALFKAQLVRELVRAIAEDELFLVYQPKYCLGSDERVGFEALVRWQHPKRGLVGPADFIALAEEAGLIVDLGRWVLERAVRQVREWHDRGLGWQHVAVNVSALQLRSGHFAGCVRQALTLHGVPGDQVQIELTESSLVVDTDEARDLVRQMHAMGLSVAVDDFGTGYSSLAALQQFDIDCLKIDRAFVDAIETRGGEEICRAVIDLAHALNMRVVAEGVETAVQRDTLRRLGCDQVQGFLYARPMPAHELFRPGPRQASAQLTSPGEFLPV